MIEGGANPAQGVLEDAEVEEHPPRVKFPSPRMGKDPVVMAVQALALSMVVREEMGGGEIGLDAYLVHAPIIAGRCCQHKTALIQ